ARPPRRGEPQARADSPPGGPGATDGHRDRARREAARRPGGDHEPLQAGLLFRPAHPAAAPGVMGRAAGRGGTGGRAGTAAGGRAGRRGGRTGGRGGPQVAAGAEAQAPRARLVVPRAATATARMIASAVGWTTAATSSPHAKPTTTAAQRSTMWTRASSTKTP